MSIAPITKNAGECFDPTRHHRHVNLVDVGFAKVLLLDGDPTNFFREDFLKLIMSKEYSQADHLLYNHGHLRTQLAQKEAFDPMLESILENPKNADRYVQAARL